MLERIPFNRPTVTGNESAYLADALARGHIAGDGYYTRRCEALLEETHGTHRALLTTSCSDALELAGLLADLHPGDDVVLPSFTFASCANAVALRGSNPIFADIRPDTLGLDVADVERRLTPRTKAIILVHYAGVATDVEAFHDLAAARGVMLIEDNAHGLYGSSRGRLLGTFGSLATLSFHETKNLTCGEGGALLINDETHVERAQVLREKGTNRARFLRGQIDKYSWIDVGSSFVPSDLLAAFLLAQLESRDTVLAKRAAIWNRYDTELAAWAAGCGARLPFVPPTAGQAYHMFAIIMPTAAARDGLIAYLAERNIVSVFHYIPLGTSEMARRLGAWRFCPVSEDVSARLVRLPFFTGLGAEQQSRVIAAVTAFRP